jgi:hypothetical protein
MRGAQGLYSRLVAVLKIGLPLMAVAMLLSLFLFPREERVEPGLDLLGGRSRGARPGSEGQPAGADRATRDDDPFRFTARR